MRILKNLKDKLKNGTTIMVDKNTTIVNGKVIETDGDSIVCINGNTVTVNGKRVDINKDCKEIIVSGDIGNLKASGPVIVKGNVKGDVNCTNFTCDGDVGGDVDATNVTCENIAGDVDATNVIRG